MRSAATEIAFATSGPVAVIHTDLDGDGLLDVALLDLSKGQIVVWTGHRANGFQRVEHLVPGGRLQGQARAERLTPREKEVADLLRLGWTDKEIAARLGVGRRTVESHVANIRGKLGLRSRRDLLPQPSGAP